MLPSSSTTATQRRAPLGPNFLSGPPAIRLIAPETPASESLGELSLAVQPPPLRLVPPGHASCVSWDDVRDDPNMVAPNCEDEYSQERTTNVAEASKGAAAAAEDDDITLADPAEQAVEMVAKDVNLQSLINKCLRLSVKHTRVASRDARLLGLQSLRGQRVGGLTACASSNLESDDEDEDLEDDDDDEEEEEEQDNKKKKSDSHAKPVAEGGN